MRTTITAQKQLITKAKNMNTINSNNRTFLATSNHGNHTGFNRTWKVEEVNVDKSNPLIDIALKVSDNHTYVDDSSEAEYTSNPQYVGAGVYDESMNQEVSPADTTYEHDLVYYMLISENEIDAYAGDNGHYSGLHSALCDAAATLA